MIMLYYFLIALVIGTLFFSHQYATNRDVELWRNRRTRHKVEQHYLVRNAQEARQVYARINANEIYLFACGFCTGMLIELVLIV